MAGWNHGLDGVWVWVNSGSWWWTGRPGVLRFMDSQRVGHDWATELHWTELKGVHTSVRWMNKWFPELGRKSLQWQRRILNPRMLSMTTSPCTALFMFVPSPECSFFEVSGFLEKWRMEGNLHENQDLMLAGVLLPFSTVYDFLSQSTGVVCHSLLHCTFS